MPKFLTMGGTELGRLTQRPLESKPSNYCADMSTNNCSPEITAMKIDHPIKMFRRVAALRFDLKIEAMPTCMAGKINGPKAPANSSMNASGCLKKANENNIPDISY